MPHDVGPTSDQTEAIQELHRFTRRIGLPRSWFQRYSSPHYDLSPHYRALAVQAGAEAVTSRELVRRCVLVHRHGRGK